MNRGSLCFFSRHHNADAWFYCLSVVRHFIEKRGPIHDFIGYIWAVLLAGTTVGGL